MSLLNDERENYIFGGIARQAGKFLPSRLRGAAKYLSKLSQVGDYANFHDNKTGYRSPFFDTQKLLRRKKPKYESDGYFLLAESEKRKKDIGTPASINKFFKELEKEYLENFPKDFHADVKEAVEQARQLDLDAIKNDKLSFKSDQKEIRNLINKLKGTEKNRTEMKDGGVSMLKPDYIDIDGDDNKIEPMKIAVKQRDGMAIGGLLEDDREQYVIGGAISAIKKGITKLLAKVKESAGKRQDSKRVVELRTTLKEFDDYDSMLQKKMADDPVNTDYTEEFELLQEAKFYVESELTQFSKMNRAEGGEIQEEEELPMELENSEMLPDDEMEDEFLDYVLDTALTDQEEEMLMSKLEQDGEMSMLFDKVIDVAQEFAGSGPVEGPGSGVSDSIPARLSDGEFVFTAKAVEEIGADNLMAMMKDAEMKADDRQGLAEGGEPEEETVEMPVEKSATKQDIRVVKTTVDNGGKGLLDEDEISKSIKSKMMLDNRTGRHVQS